jgi:MerR family transcriptional regulator, thiopeptide resistance regulator
MDPAPDDHAPSDHAPSDRAVTDPMTGNRSKDGYSVGEVARLGQVTVRALHHYDEIGLLRPTGRSDAGYRQYSADDLARLRDVLSYRELGFPLQQVAKILDDPETDPADHLRDQHRLVRERISRLGELLGHLEKMMEARQMGIDLSPEDQLEIFGGTWPTDEMAAEADREWGGTDAWAQSRRRSAVLTKQDWTEIKKTSDALEADLAVALGDGVPADDERAMQLAERHRQGVQKFYDCSSAMHRRLAQMYLTDPRFKKHYEDVATGLAQYLHDAIGANAERLDG